ncbi:hypothetical protein [Lettuce chordovirus 1]|uniref:Uncharacterized protein n=1 Tax=Lettuce chordovirus 1 TaxID=2200955 RepID=A0A2S1ZRD0_9VIRU|nr:hypothetical protein [Lettuce chordovirus 1]AWK28020.1 hypothetical protein [Lettuce chordovirus 1]
MHRGSEAYNDLMSKLDSVISLLKSMNIYASHQSTMRSKFEENQINKERAKKKLNSLKLKKKKLKLKMRELENMSDENLIEMEFSAIKRGDKKLESRINKELENRGLFFPDDDDLFEDDEWK